MIRIQKKASSQVKEERQIQLNSAMTMIERISPNPQTKNINSKNIIQLIINKQPIFFQMQLAKNVIKFFQIVLESYLKEFNSKIYCEVSYFKSLLKIQSPDLSKIEKYLCDLEIKRKSFLVESKNILDKSKSREKDIKATPKPQLVKITQKKKAQQLKSKSIDQPIKTGISIIKPTQKFELQEKYKQLKQNVQYLSNLFGRNNAKLSENDILQKTRFVKRTEKLSLPLSQGS